MKIKGKDFEKVLYNDLQKRQKSLKEKLPKMENLINNFTLLLEAKMKRRSANQEKRI
jgi:hypothetical protein